MADYLSDDKIAECKEIFDLFDQNGDSHIGIKELEEILRALGTSIPYEEILNLCKRVNHNFNEEGKLKFDDFLKIFVQFKDKNIEEDISNGFEILDSKNEGIISLSQLKKVLTSIGEPLSKEELDDFLENSGLNRKLRDNKDENDIKIDKESFIKIMMNNNE